MNRATLSLGLLVAGTVRRPPAAGGTHPPPRRRPKPDAIGIIQSRTADGKEVRRGILHALAEAGASVTDATSATPIRTANNAPPSRSTPATRRREGGPDRGRRRPKPSRPSSSPDGGPPSSSAPSRFPTSSARARRQRTTPATSPGSSPRGPSARRWRLIRELLPKARRVGSLWTSSEINSEYYLDLAREAGAALGLEIVAVPVMGPHEIPASLQRLLNGRIDVLFPMSDNTLNSSFDVIGRAADENAVPLVASFLRSVEFGACASLGYDFYGMGLKTGRLAIRVMGGRARPGSRSSPWTRSSFTSILRRRPARASFSPRRSSAGRPAASARFPGPGPRPASFPTEIENTAPAARRDRVADGRDDPLDRQSAGLRHGPSLGHEGEDGRGQVAARSVDAPGAEPRMVEDRDTPPVAEGRRRPCSRGDRP